MMAEHKKTRLIIAGFIVCLSVLCLFAFLLGFNILSAVIWLPAIALVVSLPVIWLIFIAKNIRIVFCPRETLAKKAIIISSILCLIIAVFFLINAFRCNSIAADYKERNNPIFHDRVTGEYRLNNLTTAENTVNEYNAAKFKARGAGPLITAGVFTGLGLAAAVVFKSLKARKLEVKS